MDREQNPGAASKGRRESKWNMGRDDTRLKKNQRGKQEREQKLSRSQQANSARLETSKGPKAGRGEI